MRIAIWYECDLSGGPDWSLIDLIYNWPDRDDRFTVFVNGDHEGVPILQKFLPSHVDVNVVNKRIFPRYWVNRFQSSSFGRNEGEKVGNLAIKIVSKILYLGFLPIQFFTLFFLLRGLECDCMLLSNGGYPGGTSNIPALFWSYVFSIPERYMIVRNIPVKSPFRLILDPQCRKMLSGMVAISHVIERKIFDENIIQKEKLHLIYPGISLNEAKKSENEFKKQNSLQYIGIVGHLSPKKGHEVLIKALSFVQKDYPDLMILIVGSDPGNRKAELIEFAKYVGANTDRLLWLGYVHSVFNVVKQMDILVLPSVAFESFGRVIVEAMAFNVPVIASRLDGIPEIISDKKNGLLFTPQKAEELAVCIRILLDDPSYRKSLADEGHKTFLGRFTASAIAQQYYLLLKGSL